MTTLLGGLEKTLFKLLVKTEKLTMANGRRVVTDYDSRKQEEKKESLFDKFGGQ